MKAKPMKYRIERKQKGVLCQSPDNLRKEVLRTEAEIREIMDSNPTWRADRHLHEKVEDLLADRAWHLNQMFLAAPEEVARFEALNEMLLKKVEDMRRRATMLWDTLLKLPRVAEFDDVYEVWAEFRVRGDRSDEEAVLKLPEDEYYGSDFALANEALVEAMPRSWNHAQCLETTSPADLENGYAASYEPFTDTMEDGQSWAEGPLRHPALDHICICYPIHDLVTHRSFSIPDLLRINHFSTNVSLEISNSATQ